MKRWITIAIGCVLMGAIGGWSAPAAAGTADQIREGSKEAAHEIKEDAVQTGKAMVETGKEIKEGSQKGWSDFKQDAVKAGKSVKESVKEAGKDFKKAFKETKEAVKKEFTGDADEASNK